MIELVDNSLHCSFPEVHPEAKLEIHISAHNAHPRRREGLSASTWSGSVSIAARGQFLRESSSDNGSSVAALCCPCTSPKRCGLTSKPFTSKIEKRSIHLPSR